MSFQLSPAYEITRAHKPQRSEVLMDLGASVFVDNAERWEGFPFREHGDIRLSAMIEQMDPFQ